MKSLVVKKKKRTGFSLVELLVAILVVGILIGLSLVAGSSAQDKARVSTASSVLNEYKSVFTSCVLQHPGAIDYRADAWQEALDNGTEYSTKEGLAELVTYMNKELEARLKLTWNEELKAYTAEGDDPWGGYYILTEYPESDTQSFYDPIANPSSLYCSFWATGRDDSLISNHEVTDNCIGVGLSLKDGIVTHWYHGFEDGELSFLDTTIPMK